MDSYIIILGTEIIKHKIIYLVFLNINTRKMYFYIMSYYILVFNI